MEVPKANIFEHCRNMTRARRLHLMTEIDYIRIETSAKIVDQTPMTPEAWL